MFMGLRRFICPLTPLLIDEEEERRRGGGDVLLCHCFSSASHSETSSLFGPIRVTLENVVQWVFFFLLSSKCHRLELELFKDHRQVWLICCRPLQ